MNDKLFSFGALGLASRLGYSAVVLAALWLAIYMAMR